MCTNARKNFHLPSSTNTNIHRSVLEDCKKEEITDGKSSMNLEALKDLDTPNSTPKAFVNRIKKTIQD